MLPRVLPALAASLLSLSLLAGCTEEPIAAEDKILIPSTSSPLGPSDGKAGGEVAGKKSKKRAKARQPIVAHDAGVRFRPPAGWTVLDRERVDAAADQNAGGVAQQVGMSEEALLALIAAVDVYLTDYAGMMSVGRFAGPMPTQQQFEALFGAADATVEPMQTRSTPLGEGRLFRTRMSYGDVELNGGTLYVRNGDKVVEITSAGPDGARALEVLDAVVETLERA